MTKSQVKTFGRYIILHTIGKGEFGKVKLAYDPQKEIEVAIKFIKRSNITSAQKQAKLEREINILQNLNHPNIVRLYDVIETEKYIGIVMAYANGGELFEYISENQYLSEEESAKFFIQLLDGVQYLHSRHIVHRDLKLENLLLDDKGDIIITDFGFANNSRKNPSGLLSTSCGSPCYAAPELVINDNYIGEAADIWSCGIILYAMLCGYLPFDDDPNNPDGENLDLLYKYILESQLTFPEYVSEDAQELVCGMLIPDPEKRWPMEKVINHKWLRNSIYCKERMNESMNIDYMYDESYLKYINESTNSEIEKIQDANVPEYPPPLPPQGVHSRQIGLDDETEHTEVYEVRNNVSINENVDSSMDKTEYIPNQELKDTTDDSKDAVVPSKPQIVGISKDALVPGIEKQSQSNSQSSSEFLDAHQELPVEVSKDQEDPMEVEEVFVAPDDKMDIDESPAQITPETSTIEDPVVLEAERQNAEKQIEKLINEIQQEQFTQLEEMKDQLQEVVKGEISEESAEATKIAENVVETPEVSVEKVEEEKVEEKEEKEIPIESEQQDTNIPEDIVEQPEDVASEAIAELTEPVVVSETSIERVEETVTPISETSVEKETIVEKVEETKEKTKEENIESEIKEEIKETNEVKEEVASPVKENVIEKVEVKEEVVDTVQEIAKEDNEEKIDSPSTIKLEKEDLDEVDELNPHSASKSESSSSLETSTSGSDKTEEKVIVEVVNEVKNEKDSEMENVKPESEKNETINDVEMKEQDSSKDSEITTMEEDEVDMLKKKNQKVKTKKEKSKIKKRRKEIKKSEKAKNKKNIKFRKFFACVMKE
ncbi:Pkinase-domain-containing protein [Anaeromyces robustus]|uniref:Pkinase-domain-containing protein n=1 Tax=Anaeromyces robustus TaxID=1754192 RepID=A0A1Y1XI62_9FUNG|nr:Pkinase-domain-containing protein [Anaeromyces robustus]|eukprot:ORX85461.1 Pkinase-domain-containing protein [Anaeromyces robustus]